MPMHIIKHLGKVNVEDEPRHGIGIIRVGRQNKERAPRIVNGEICRGLLT